MTDSISSSSSPLWRQGWEYGWKFQLWWSVPILKLSNHNRNILKNFPYFEVSSSCTQVWITPCIIGYRIVWLQRTILVYRTSRNPGLWDDILIISLCSWVQRQSINRHFKSFTKFLVQSLATSRRKLHLSGNLNGGEVISYSLNNAELNLTFQRILRHTHET